MCRVKYYLQNIDRVQGEGGVPAVQGQVHRHHPQRGQRLRVREVKISSSKIYRVLKIYTGTSYRRSPSSPAARRGSMSRTSTTFSSQLGGSAH